MDVPEQSPDPSTWDPVSFPKPNPYFKAPPRGGARNALWLFYICAAALAASAMLVAVVLIGWPEYAIAAYVMGGSVAVAASLGLIVSPKTIRREKSWRNGRVLPGEVLKVQHPRDIPIWRFVLYRLLGGLGDVAEVLEGIGAEAALKVVYIEAGVQRCSWCKLDRSSVQVKTGDVIWLVIDHDKALPAYWVNSRYWRRPRVPEEVEIWWEAAQQTAPPPTEPS